MARLIVSFRTVAILATAALLSQTLLPLVNPVRASSDNAVVLCTAGGFRMVSLADVNGPADQKPAPNIPGKINCPLCLSAHLSEVCLPSGGVSLFLSPAAAAKVFPRDQYPVVASAQYRPFQARAPPVNT